MVTDPRLTRQLLLLIAFSSIVPILIPLFARHYSTPTWVIMLISYSIPLIMFLGMTWLINSAKAAQATETPELSTEQIIDYTQQDTDEHKTRNKLWGILILVLLVVLGFFISFQQGLHSTTP